MSIAQVKEMLVKGQASLVLALEQDLNHAPEIAHENADISYALVIQFFDTPQRRIGFLFSIGGKGAAKHLQGWEEIKAWMRSRGASKVQGVCHEAHVRLWKPLGFQEVYRVVQQDL